MLQPQSKTHSGLFPVLLVIGAAVVLVFFALLPGVRKARVSKIAFRDAESAQMELERQYAQKRNIAQTLRTLDAGVRARLSQIFASQPDLGTYGQLLNGLASANNFVLTALSLSDNSKSASASGLNEVQITAQFKGGGYKDLKNLLADLTAAVPLLEVSSLTYTPESAALSLNLVSYAIKPGAPLPTILDTSLLQDPRLGKLRAPFAPAQAPPAGRENPFAPINITQ